MPRLAFAFALTIVAAALTFTAGALDVRATENAPPVDAADYDLGVVEIPDAGPRGPVPVRLWGSIAAPNSPSGARPIVIVAHGRHDNGCPAADFESTEWPCFDVEQRNDHGLRHVVEAIAAQGAIALSLDLNGAYTGGWGEPNDRSRWKAIVDATLARLVEESSIGAGSFGVPLAGRVDRSRLALVAHSLSGVNALRFARVAKGVESLFLLAPAPAGGRLPDLPTAIVLASCDGDVGDAGRRYLRRARRDPDRTEPLVLVTLKRANHNYFNRTLADLGTDDSIGTGLARCRPSRRISATAQQRWLDAAAAGFVAAEMLGGKRPAWLRSHGRPPSRLYGRRVEVERLRD